MCYCDWQTVRFFREVLFNFSAIFLWNTHIFVYILTFVTIYKPCIHTHLKCIEIISFITYFIPLLFPLNFFPNIPPVTAPLKMLFPPPHHLDTPHHHRWWDVEGQMSIAAVFSRLKWLGHIWMTVFHGTPPHLWLLTFFLASPKVPPPPWVCVCLPVCLWYSCPIYCPNS